MYNLLITDDDEIICKGLGCCIPWEQYGIQVAGLAFDGEKALEFVEKNRPDIVIVDINMPFIDGIEFSYIVRQKYPEIKIILLTAYKEFFYAKKAVKLQIFEYLTKPFTNEEVLQAVQRAAKALDTERKYRSKIGKNMKLIREKNLEEITIYGTEEKEILENSPIRSEEHFFQTAVLYLRRISDLLEEEKNTGIEDEVVCHMAETHLRNWMEHKSYCSLFVRNRRIVLVFEYEKMGESLKIKEILTDMMEEVGKDDNVFLIGGVGKAYRGVENLPTSYGEATRAIEYRYGYANRSILFYSEICMETGEKEIELAAVKKDLREGIQQRDTERIKDRIAELFREINHRKSNTLTADIFCVMEVLRFSWEMTENQKKISDFMKQSGNILGKLMKTRDPAELEETASLYFKELYGYLNSQSTTDVEKRVYQAVEYIQENYSNPELSLEEVAKAVNLSASYLGNSMKKYRKISYINMLNQIRIENAKKLLARPDTKSYEVAFLVGFNSSQYFSSCFKKSTGMAPGAYREQILKQTEKSNN